MNQNSDMHCKDKRKLKYDIRIIKKYYDNKNDIKNNNLFNLM